MPQPASAADLAAFDPKGLIRESYAIEGITPQECRSILIDWALSLPQGAGQVQAANTLIDHYGAGRAEHPMTQLLIAARSPADKPQRRGGWAGRR